jgi:hypothetical protein
MNPAFPRPLPPLPPVLDPPTAYRPTAYERGKDYAFAAFFALFGTFPAMVAATTPRTLIGLEWFFVLLLAVPCEWYALTRLMRARIRERIVVTREGFTFHAAFRRVHVAWSDVIGVDTGGVASAAVYESGWFDVRLRKELRPNRIRLQVSGLVPDGREFWRQLYRFAPGALKYEPPLLRLMRKLGWRPAWEKPRTRAKAEEMPDFESMRAEARAVTTGQDLIDIIENLDMLEREWKKRL